ncbi:unnamed protein product [Blepharisma stoltei]|uniref:Nucleolar GTP-binding protein 1 n=1 Tax=Blepharisma stoltei TaxID=1481888 RepID=A0AAU9IPB7_9CILI|nr:unnamed protein product [Blepharisma stoltei]
MNYNFKSIPSVPSAKDLIDTVLSKTQRKTPTEIHPQVQIARIRKFYMRKVKFTQSTIEEKLGEILEKFPKLDDIHPFYADLINVLYDKDHYKLALGHINKAKSLVESVAKDYVRMLKYADSLYRGKTLKKAALGRMCTILKKLSNSLNYLDEVRKHLARLPSIDPHTRSIIITGYPNVGKSSFMNNVTRANAEVQPYAFTTKSLFVGHTDYDFIPWQVIDTPGLLDRPIEERNIVEMQAITALAHINACILFFIDISEKCGYTVPQQIQLFESVQPLFTNKPLGIIITKTDLKRWEDLNPEYQQKIQEIVQKHNAFMSFISNENKEGVMECRNQACEHLKSFRENVKTKKVTTYGRSMPYVSVPRALNPSRPPHIPDSVIVEAQTGIKAREGPTPKEMQELQGGAGVFAIPPQAHFVELQDDDWKWDVMPEVMDGKNILDFVDPDILAKLEELEKEEEIQEDAHVPLDYDEYRDIYKVKRKIHLRRKRIQQESMMAKGTFKPKRKNLSEVEEGFKELGIDPSGLKDVVGVKRRRKPSPEIATNVEDFMDVEEGDGGEVIKKKLKLKNKALVKARKPGAIQPNPSRKELKIIGDEATKAFYDQKPQHIKHLSVGKRGIGKTDRR